MQLLPRTGDMGLLLGAGPGGSLSSSILISPSTRSLTVVTFSLLPRLLRLARSLLMSIRTFSVLHRSLALLLQNDDDELFLLVRSGLALPERESPEPPNRVLSRTTLFLLLSLGLAHGESFLRSATIKINENCL